MRCRLILTQALLALLCLAACSDSKPAPQRPSSLAVSSPAEVEGPLVLFFGDSLSAGLHLREDQAFPALLQQRAIAAGTPFRLINAGLSGDTTAGGRSRLGWSLRSKPDVVVLELGANDGLRGIQLGSIRSNLLAMVKEIQASGAEVLLLGMRMPPNYGAQYIEGFEALYLEVASELDVALVPFFLEGVAAVPSLNLPDGIHPNAAGHSKIAERLSKPLAGLLHQAGSTPAD
jgi:acyl-CoA thioesterase-1